MFVVGDSHESAHVTVVDGSAAILDGTLDANGGEVIVIHDRRKPQYTTPLADPRIVPAYSDEAVLSDAWSKAWLLLDVSATGTVTRFKFLKRPGHGLDKIATETAFATKCVRARDAAGNAAHSFVVWPIEWPSHGWLMDRFGSVGRLPDDVQRYPLTRMFHRAPARDRSASRWARHATRTSSIATVRCRIRHTPTRRSNG